jgi:hypothetical protein
MKAHEFIARLDEARYGRRVTEDAAPVAKSPDHAPTSTAQWKTPSSGKSKDEGERTGGEKDAIKKSDSAIPAPIAKAPSHAPTSTAQWKTAGQGKSDDEGEKISKEAMKEDLLDQLINSDEEVDIEAIMAEAELREAGHKAGCQCGFCKNMGKLKKKDSGDDGGNDDDNKDDGKEPVAEAGMMRRPGRSFGGPAKLGAPLRGRIGKPMAAGARGPGPARMGFRHPSATSPRPKAAINPHQPAMERLDAARNPARAIQQMADELLESPNGR